MAEKRTSTENVFLFVPNLIGYMRVVLALVSLYFMPFDPYLAMPIYWLSAFLDAFDGLAARYYDQSTTFGSVLDMVSDRCTTICLMFTCALFYPSYTIFFQLLATLDIASHWFQMYSSMLHGRTTHKVIDLKDNRVLRYYYSKPVLFSLCSFNELFFMSLYLNHFGIGWPVVLMGYTFTAWQWIGLVSTPFFLLKHLISAVQLVVACKNIASHDAEMRSHRPKKD